MAASTGQAPAGISIPTASPDAVSATAGAAGAAQAGAAQAGAAQAWAEVVNGGGDARIRAYAIVADNQAARASGLGIRIRSGDGNDSIAGITTGSLAIDAGGGDNRVAASFGGLGDVTPANSANSLALAGNLGTVAAGDGGNAIAVAGLGTLATTGAGADMIEDAQWVNAGQGDDAILLGNADLTLAMGTSGETLTIHHYSAGRVTFLFDNRDSGGGISGSRTLAGLG